MSAIDSSSQSLPEYETVSTLFYKLTSPMNNGHVDRDLLAAFCRKIDCEPAGRSVALQIMIHKIQSPFEAEALITLEVLKTCVESCDLAFRQEIGKFKFLNELIKVLSPKYLGSKSSDKVKKRISELFYSWTLLMPTQPKIAEAYRLLRKQNLIVGNPDRQSFQDDRKGSAQSQRMSSIFNDSTRTRRIAELLKSTNPEDILEANRLIKRLAQEDELRATKLYQRSIKVRSIKTSAVVLDEMIDNFDPKSDSHDILQLLYNELKQNSVTLQEMATSADEIDDRLGEVLEVNDLTLHVLKRFEDSKLHEYARTSPARADRDDVTELINLTEDEIVQTADLIVANVPERHPDSLIDDALSEVFNNNKHSSSPSSEIDTANKPNSEELEDVILRQPTTAAKAEKNGLGCETMETLPETSVENSALLELDKVAAQMVNDEFSKGVGRDPTTHRRTSSATNSLLDLLAPLDLETTELQSPPEAPAEEKASLNITEQQASPTATDSDFALKISDFIPLEGSGPKKLLERNGLRLTVFQGKKLEKMAADSFLILLTLENHGPKHITDLDIEFGESALILQREGTKVGELLPFNPVLPTSSYVQLFLLRFVHGQPTIEINMSYKVNSDRHFLHAEHTLLA